MNYRMIDYGNSRLFYNPETGEFIRQFKHGRVRRKVGQKMSNGYLRIRVNLKNVLAHRLAFEMMGEPLPKEVDHIDGNRSNNSWMNLRPASIIQNRRNSKTPKTNKSGVKGVSWESSKKRWRASLRCGDVRPGKYFRTLNEAENWIRQKREELHGEFVNHG